MSTLGSLLAYAWLPITGAAAAEVTASPDSTWQTNGRVRAIRYSSGVAYLGGHFTAVRPPGAAAGSGEVIRNHAAAFEASTGDLVGQWNPDVDGNVWDIAVSPDGSRVYLGGSFSTVGGLPRKGVAAVNASTGAVISSWRANVGGSVYALELSADGSRLYVGGIFSKITRDGIRYDRSHLAELDAATGAPTAWSPLIERSVDPSVSCPPRCEPSVNSLEFSRQRDAIYVGGHFGAVDRVERSNAAEIWIGGARRGTLTEWDPYVFLGAPTNPNQKNFVYSIEAAPQQTSYADRVFFCGDFWQVNGNRPTGGVRSPNVAAVDPLRGDVDRSWGIFTDGGTWACELSPSGHLYLGGHFQNMYINRDLVKVPRSHIASADAATSEPEDWNPGANSILGLHEMEISPSGAVASGGDFSRTGRRDQQGFAQFSRQDTTPPTQPGQPAGVSHTWDSIRLTWQASTDDTERSVRYQIYRDGSTAPVATIASSSTTQVVYTDTGLAPGSLHTYRVVATDGWNASPPSVSSPPIKVVTHLFWDGFESGFSEWHSVSGLSLDTERFASAAPSARAEAAETKTFAQKNLSQTHPALCLREAINLHSGDAQNRGITLMRFRAASGSFIGRTFISADRILKVHAEVQGKQFSSGTTLPAGWNTLAMCATVGAGGEWALTLNGTRIGTWSADNGNADIGSIQIGDSAVKTYVANVDDVAVDPYSPG